MTKQDINHIYEQSVYEIRLKVAIGLLSCPGINQDRALEEADKFIQLLLAEDADELVKKYK